MPLPFSDRLRYPCTILVSSMVAIGAAIGTYMIGMPAVIGVAYGSTAVAYAAITYDLARKKDALIKDLIPHPKSYSYKTDLHAIITELYQKANVRGAEPILYDLNEPGIIDTARIMRHSIPVIQISKPLLQMLNDAETKAVLAHEMAHHKQSRVPETISKALLWGNTVCNGMMYCVSTAMTGLISFAAGTFLSLKVADIGILLRKKADQDSDGTQTEQDNEKAKCKMYLAMGLSNVAFFSIFNPAIPVIAAATYASYKLSQLTSMALSRSAEYDADCKIVELGACPLAMMTALRKIEVIQYVRGITSQAPWQETPIRTLTSVWKQLQETHPTIEQRIKRLTQIARASGYGENAITHARSGCLDMSNMGGFLSDIMPGMFDDTGAMVNKLTITIPRFPGNNF